MKSPEPDEIIFEGFDESGPVRVAKFRKGDLTAAGVVEKDEDLALRMEEMPSFFKAIEKAKEEEEARIKEIRESAPPPAESKGKARRISREKPRVKKKGCCGGRKTLGLLSLSKAIMSGTTTREIASERINLCFTCDELDPNMVPLYREIDGIPYCGEPRLSDVYRDEFAEGCGCNLHEKVQYNNVACPRGRWGPA